MSQIFPMVPATGKALWVIAAILVPLVALIAYLAYASRHVRFEVSNAGLRIRGDIYGRRIPADALMCSEAKAVDLETDTSLKPRLRTNGVGLPGYRAGWFRLRNGEKALVFLTDSSRVAYIPTRNGYSLLLSVADPPSFLDTVRTICH